MCLIFNFYIPFLTSVEEVDEEDEGRPEMPLERESFPEYEGKQRKWIKRQPVKNFWTSFICQNYGAFAISVDSIIGNGKICSCRSLHQS